MKPMNAVKEKEDASGAIEKAGSIEPFVWWD